MSLTLPRERRIGPRTAVTSDKPLFRTLLQTLCQIPLLVLTAGRHEPTELQVLRQEARVLVKRALGNATVVTGPHRSEPFLFTDDAEILELRLHTQVVGRDSIRVHVLYKEPFDTEPREVWLELNPAEYFKTDPLP